MLYLDMPTEATEQMMRLREAATHTTADIHERDEGYLRRLPRKPPPMWWSAAAGRAIDCAREGAPRLIDDIHNEVMERVARPHRLTR